MHANEIAEILNNNNIGLKKASKLKLIPYSDKKARDILTDAGYTYSNIEKKWIEKLNTNTNLPNSNNVEAEKAYLLYDRSRIIPTENRVRKTIQLTKETNKSFDILAKKYKIDKSDLAEIAFVDFIEQYGIKE